MVQSAPLYGPCVHSMDLMYPLLPKTDLDFEQRQTNFDKCLRLAIATGSSHGNL